MKVTGGTQQPNHYAGQVLNRRPRHLPNQARKQEVGGVMHKAPVHHFHASLVADHIHAQLDPMNNDQRTMAARAQKPGLPSGRLQHSKYGGGPALAVVSGAATAQAHGTNAGMVGTTSNRVGHLPYQSGDHAVPSCDKASTCQPTLQAAPGASRNRVATYHPAMNRHTGGAPGRTARSRVAGDWGRGKVLGRLLYDRRDSAIFTQPASRLRR